MEKTNVNKLLKLSFIVAVLAFASIIASAQTPPAQAPAGPTIAPSPSLVKSGKCYELRTYVAAPGKLEDLHKRFRDHTIKLFKKHGMEVVGFWGPTDKENAAHLAALQGPAIAQQSEAVRVSSQSSQGQLAALIEHDAVPKRERGDAAKAGTPWPYQGLDTAGNVRIVTNGRVAHLGAPPVRPGQALDGRAVFLRELHGKSCNLFGTVLGPEANNAHRNHMHLDLAERRNGAFCR